MSAESSISVKQKEAIKRTRRETNNTEEGKERKKRDL